MGVFFLMVIVGFGWAAIALKLLLPKTGDAMDSDHMIVAAGGCWLSYILISSGVLAFLIGVVGLLYLLGAGCAGTPPPGY